MQWNLFGHLLSYALVNLAWHRMTHILTCILTPTLAFTWAVILTCVSLAILRRPEGHKKAGSKSTGFGPEIPWHAPFCRSGAHLRNLTSYWTKPSQVPPLKWNPESNYIWLLAFGLPFSFSLPFWSFQRHVFSLLAVFRLVAALSLATSHPYPPVSCLGG